jgi:hypothetical protein
MFAKSAALLAALSLAASPTLAQPSAQPLSIQPAAARAGAPIHDGSQLQGSILPPILFLAIIVGGILLATGVIGANHHPHSP